LGDERFALGVAGDVGEHDDQIGSGVAIDDRVESRQLQPVVGLDTQRLGADVDGDLGVEILPEEFAELVLDRGHTSARGSGIADEQDMHFPTVAPPGGPSQGRRANSDGFPTALSARAAGRREDSPAGHVVGNRTFSDVEESTRRRRARAMAVLVTGGAGYIGSHVVRLLTERGDDVLVVDYFSTGLTARVDGLDVVDLDLAAADAEDRLTAAIEEHSVDS